MKATQTRSTPEKASEAKKDLTTWLKSFASRLSSADEISAWTAAEVLDEAKGVKIAIVNGAEKEWEAKRQAEMLRVNPRFVLRQWVLEELIAKLEESGVEDIQKGRKDLAKILEVSVSISSPQMRGLGRRAYR